MIQAAILVFGAIGAGLIARGGRAELLGFVVAFLAQPFWLVETFAAGQWGMHLLACWYTCAWGWGAWTRWEDAYGR